MKRSMIRTVTVVAAALALSLVSAMSASAAGPPIINNVSFTEIGELLNVAKGHAGINPNGSPTSYTMEYGLNKVSPPEVMERSTSAVNIGSGTSEVPVSGELYGMNPHTSFYFRVVATNSFGTTYSGFQDARTAQWVAHCFSCGHGSWSFPERYKATGTFKFEQAAAPKMTITCVESGYGYIGNYQGVGDEYTLEPHSCSWEGHPECAVSFRGPWKLKPNFESTEAVDPELQVSGECQEFSEKIVSTPFKLAMGPEEIGVLKQPMTLTQHAHFGANAVTITDTAEWSLAGLGLGEKFAWDSV